jgi:hypothetical protein
MASQGKLRSYRCGDSIGGTSKGHEEGIPLRVELAAVMPTKSRTQQLAALAQDTCVAFA